MGSVTIAPIFVILNMNNASKYPRYPFKRAILGGIAKGLLRLLAKVNIQGLDNIPKKGPVILAGNHVENLETVFQMIYPKRNVEPIGAGDIPFDKGMDGIVNLYGFIAVDRGTVDRGALREAQSVLEQGGALSIFPEGGTWRPGKMPAQLGVALLSERGNAPVVPIGYSGFTGSMKAAFSFKRPKLIMRVGKPIPAFELQKDGPSKKDQMQAYADEVMRQVHALLDESEHNIAPEREEYHLQIQLMDKNGKLERQELPEGSDAFVSFINLKVILNTLKDSLHLPTQAFYSGQEGQKLDDLIKAIDATMRYLNEKPSFFTYRMGQEFGSDVPRFLEALRTLAVEAQELEKCLLIDARVKEFYLNGQIRDVQHSYKFE